MYKPSNSKLQASRLERPQYSQTYLYTSDLYKAGSTMLIHLSQSKLSQEQLNQLQRDTHFDKKELQQWYKG